MTFTAWVGSPAFQHGHGARPAGGPEAAATGGEGARPPVATSSELWQYRVEQHSSGGKKSASASPSEEAAT